MSEKRIELSAQDKEYVLSATFSPDNTLIQELYWSSSDNKVAFVDKNGSVTAVTPGTATIYAQSMYYPDLIDSCIVIVTPRPYIKLSTTDITASFMDNSECIVNFESNIAMSALQFDVVLPDQLAFNPNASIKLNSDRLPDHTVSYKVRNDGSIRFIIGSQSNANILEESGQLLSFGLTVKDTIETTTQIQLKNIVTSTEAGKIYELADTSSVVNLYLPTFLVSYYVDGSPYHTDTLKYASSISAIECPVQEGYTFSGWSEIPDSMPANDVTVTGSFSVNNYLLVYKVEGDTVSIDSIAYGTALTAKEDPTKEGYTFSGWSEIPTTMPANDVTVIGSFTVNTYMVYYMLDGELYDSTAVEYGAIIEPVADPVNEGYEFQGWSGFPVDMIMPAGDVIVTGAMIESAVKSVFGTERTVIFNLNGQRINGEIYALPEGIYIINGRKITVW